MSFSFTLFLVAVELEARTRATRPIESTFQKFPPASFLFTPTSGMVLAYILFYSSLVLLLPCVGDAKSSALLSKVLEARTLLLLPFTFRLGTTWQLHERPRQVNRVFKISLLAIVLLTQLDWLRDITWLFNLSHGYAIKALSWDFIILIVTACVM